jgi:aspartate dehydrogenase
MEKRDGTIRLGLLGLGAIGGYVLDRLDREPGSIEVVGAADLCDSPPDVAAILDRRGIRRRADAAAMIDDRPDVVLEAAGVDAAASFVPFFLERGVSVVCMSSGALAEPALLDRVTRLCRPDGPRLVVPSGAVAGIDLLRAAALGRLDRVHLRTVKPAASLGGGKSAPEVLFSGNAAEAIRRFPRNINVAVTLSLAGLGAERTTVEIVADPAATFNTHTVTIEGEFGTAEITVRNFPSPSNPKTSALAGLSALAALRALSPAIRLGT